MLKTIIFQQKLVPKLFRNLTVVATEPNLSNGRIKAWQVHSYGENLQFCKIRNPMISTPSEVLIKIEAASVNPIDILMKDGYGRTFLKFFRCSNELGLPLILGRDFAGVIADKGHNVKNFQIGDKVYGVIPFHKQGSHAEYAVVDKNHIVQQPCALTHIEAAAIPYTALTVYSALWFTGGLMWKRTKGMKILILGASGGVGTCATQMLRSVGVTIVATCSADAVPLVQSLGADCVFDYKDPDYVRNVAGQGKFDIILDSAQIGSNAIPPSWKYSSYIALNSPLLKNTDKYGLLGGLAYSAAELIPSNISKLPQGKCVKWAYFYPSNDGLQFMDKLVRNNQLTPIIHKVFKFDDLPEAYKTTKSGHLRGKIVIDMLKDHVV